MLLTGVFFVGGTATVSAAGQCPNPYATYTVKWGDSLSQIANGYGISTSYLAEYNGIDNPNVISEGQMLCIPTQPESKPTPAPKKTVGHFLRCWVWTPDYMGYLPNCK